MKKIFLLTSFLILFCFNLWSYAYDPKYTVNTSAKDIDFKRKQALQWNSDNIDNNKFYWYDAKKHVSWLKDRALKWFENNVTNDKFYFVHSDKELEFTKKKALRWHDRNSQ